MNKFTKILTAGTFAFASMAASAADITVGGVTWDPDYNSFSGVDFVSTGTFTQWFSTAGINGVGAPNAAPVLPGTVGSMLQGVGEISVFNGSTNHVCATCELTFSFGGLVYDNDLTDGSVYDLAASQGSGFFNIYFDNTADFDGGNLSNQADINNAVDGSLFLSLSFDTLKESSGFLPTTGHIDSFWSVSGGAAAGNFDTNEQLSGSDIEFSASVQFNGGYGTSVGIASGNSIPEPTTLAIFGLGLLGLAGAARRKA